jgi:enoyl-CoA hydratase/carnithine racemase
MPEVQVERAADAWTVTLDRPGKANALTAGLVEALHAVVDEAASAKVPVLAFRGNGKHFCAGFDFGGLDDHSDGDLVHRFVRIEMLLQAIDRLPALTVAFAQGRNFGAGVDLFAACRWRIAAPEATFRMPGLAFGLVLGTRRFAGIVGRENAREVLESLAAFEAWRGLEMGFVRRIAPMDSWEAVLEEARAASRILPMEHRARLARTLEGDSHDADLADLARSAAVPGLKDRIRRYLAAPTAAN